MYAHAIESTLGKNRGNAYVKYNAAECRRLHFPQCPLLNLRLVWIDPQRHCVYRIPVRLAPGGINSDNMAHHMYSRFVIIALLLAGLLILHPAAANAGLRIETLKSTTTNGKPAAALVVNGETVMRLAKQQRNHSAMYMVTFVAAQLADAHRRGPLQLTVAEDSEGVGLYLNGELLVVASKDEAKAWGVTNGELAAAWRDKLTSALALSTPTKARPQPQPQPASPARPAAPAPKSGGILDMGTTQDRSDASYSGVKPSGGHKVYEAPQLTKLEGAHLPGELTAQVTGRRLSYREAERSVENAIRCYSGVGSDTRVSWKSGDLYEDGFSLSPGNKKNIEVSYALDGGAGAKSGTLNVLLENRSITTPKETLTFFSNNPEGVEQRQLLYYASLPEGSAGRLVLHHQNQTSSDLEIVARVVNTGNSAAALHVIEGMSPPNINTFYIGFKSAEEFWNNLNAGIGSVLTIPAGRQAVIARQKLPRGYTSSGYFKLTNLGHEQLFVETIAVTPGAKLPDGLWEDRRGASSSVFPEPQILRTHTYNSGDNWLYMRLGDEQPESAVGDGKILHGCYGVTHTYNVELNNPTNTPQLFFVVLRASAGEVKGQFFIDDEYFVTPLVAGGEEFLLKEIPMRPGQTKLLKIAAIPLNGGFYPASIIVRESRHP